MYKKLLVLLSIIVSMNTFADDNEDIKYIYKLYQNKDYKISAEESEKFLFKYPGSKHYDVAQNLLGQSFYQIKEYEKAQKIFNKLLNSAYSSDANYYLALINIETGNLNIAYNYSKGLKDINREKILYTLAVKEYSNNNLNKAREYFEELRRIKGVYKNNALFNLGLISYNSGSYLDASVYLGEYLNYEKEDIEKISTTNYMLAYSYDKLGNKPLAVEYYNIIEKNYPNSSYYNLAIRDLFYYWMEQKNDEKISEYTNKLADTQFAEMALLNTGNYYYNAQNNQKAIIYYEKLLSDFTSSEATLYLAKSYMNIGKTDEALVQFKKLALNDKFKNEYYYYTAYTYFQSEKYNDVIALLDGIETKVVKDKSVYYQLIADSAYKLEDYSKAQKYYALIFNEKKTKDDFYRYYLVSSLNKDTKVIKELFDYYKINFAKDKTYNESVYLIMGNVYVGFGEDKNAEGIYSEGLKNEYSEQLLENLIIVQIRLNKFEEAYKNLNRLDSDENRDFTKGTILISMKKYEEAVSSLEKLLSQTKNKELKEKIFIKLAQVYLLEKNYQETILTVEKYEKLGYGYSKEIYDAQSIAYFRLGQFEKSRKVYEKILSMEKDKGESYYMIAESYYNEKNYEGAKEYYKKAYASTNDEKIKKDSAYWLIRVEDLLLNKIEVLARIKSFREIYPNSDYEEDITYLVARIYEEGNERKNAINEYAKLYEMSSDIHIKDDMAKRITELYTEEKDIKNAYIWSNRVSEEAYKYLWQAYIMELEGKNNEAIKNYEKIVNDKSYGDSANYKLGTYYLGKSDYKKSRGYFEKVLEFETSLNSERAQYNIGITYEKEKDYLKAVSSFLKIKLLVEDSALDDLIIIQLGEKYEKLNDSNKSYEYFKEYYTKYSGNKDYAYVTEKLLVNRIQVKNISEMKEYYNELLKINPAAAKQYAEYIK